MCDDIIRLTSDHATLDGQFTSFSCKEDKTFDFLITTLDYVKEENKDQREAVDACKREGKDVGDGEYVQEETGIFTENNKYRMAIDVPELSEEITLDAVRRLSTHLGREIVIDGYTN